MGQDKIIKFDLHSEIRTDGSGVNTNDDTDHNHTHHAHDVATLGVAIFTISSSRSVSNDAAGDAIAAAFESEGHTVVTREIVDDDTTQIQSVVETAISDTDTDIIVTTGGTGVTPDDVTIEAVSQQYDKSLPGFGELFRRRSEAEIGTRVLGTRATAGIIDTVPVFCLPGSENAATLGSNELIVPEASHLAGLAARDET
ncbi:molybdenum cofactor biosynthesis protein B [Haloquadratum walsbyi]|uniref:Molybdenum cofactor synthesis domain protein n=1 Tax=Haloquadratum walsbyi J07HQW2 TaxID=1238425 RepID=U1NE25_9EURY|nr:MogA/MoaB family molybdenum cofactor biosynthesis protein [Haloquadratum walsbyi]ERG95255.1 MAG: molybdenum cofactor synthesis domain protein [Haloquadratum walsbyi J07HQW2]